MKAGDDILNELTTAVDEAGRSYHRLVLLIGPSGSGKTPLLRQLANRSSCNVLNAGFKECWQGQDYDSILKVANRVKDSIIQEDAALLMYVDNAQMLTGG